MKERRNGFTVESQFGMRVGPRLNLQIALSENVKEPELRGAGLFGLRLKADVE